MPCNPIGLGPAITALSLADEEKQILERLVAESRLTV